MRAARRASNWAYTARNVTHRIHRGLSVLTWGRNEEGQCGHRDTELVLVPTALEQLQGQAVVDMALGRQHSCAILENGEAWTWGCGSHGKLGIGTLGLPFTARVPTRVEQLVGNAHVRAAALGEDHTLFLDRAGDVWTCGENKEGQCGMGTALETLAAQRRAALGPGGAALWGAGAGQGDGSLMAGMRPNSNIGLANHHYLHPFVEHTQRHEFVHDVRRLWDSGQQEDRGWLPYRDSSRPTLPEDSRFSSLVGASLARATHGYVASPTRLGRDLHPLLAGGPGGPDPGVEGKVVSIAASKYFSVLVTDDGRVWTFGGGFNGQLGHPSSWQTQARPVEGDVAQMIKDHGGAVQVEAGHAFCICLTRSGSVIAWGNVPCTFQRPYALVELGRHTDIKYIAAGHRHALLSNGERVWAAGCWLNGRGTSIDYLSATAMPGDCVELKRLRDKGVTGLASGFHASAAISGDGRLYMWGHLMNQDSAWKLWKTMAPQQGRAKVQPTRRAFDRHCKQSFLGSDFPKLVPGISGVKAVAVGATHAAVAVEASFLGEPARGG